MTNIESIKEDYNIGDAIRIKCSLGIKEGFIVDFSESRIKIRPFEEGRKPMSISEENIEDFEEAFPPETSIPSEAKQTEGEDLHNESMTGQANTNVGLKIPIVKGHIDIDKIDPKHGVREAVHVNENTSRKPAETIKVEIVQKKDQPSHVKGYIDINSVDSRGGIRPGVYKKNPWKLALLEQPNATCPSALQRISNSYNSEIDNQSVVYATGFITDNNNKYGWIWDQNLETKIWFSFDNVCDDQLSALDNVLGVHVSYIKIDGGRGPKAIGICLPRKISELLAFADILQDDFKTKQNAYDITELILSIYPDNEDAKYMQKGLKSSIEKRTKHSVTSRLSYNDLKENSILGEDKINKKDVNAELSKENAIKAKDEYSKAKALTNKKRHEEALKHYLAAFELQKTINLVKDISSLYCSLCSNKYIQGHPDRIAQAEHYRLEGRKFLEKNAHLLPKEQSSYYSLEASYYVLHEYEKFIEVVDKIIRVQVPAQRVIYLNKKVVALIALKRKEEALKVIDTVLHIDPQNANALKLQQHIKANEVIDEEQFEDSDNPICLYLRNQIENYNEYFGVLNYIRTDESRLFSEETYEMIVQQLESENISSDSVKRSKLLLTKTKLSMKLHDGHFDKRDIALYCNDMARLSIIGETKQWDAARFYFNESFALSASWMAVRRQFVQYLETYLISRRNEIFGILPDGEIKERMRDDLIELMNQYQDKSDSIWIDILLEASIHNEEISKRITDELYSNTQLKGKTLEIFSELLDDYIEQNIDKERYIQIWQDLIVRRYSSQKVLNNSFVTRTSYSNLAKLNNSINGLNEESNVSWLFSRDKERLNVLYRQVIPKVESFVSAQSYISKEDNYRDSSRLLHMLSKEIIEEPTKFSYESLYPLIIHYKKLLDETWQNIITTSKPKITIELQSESVLVDKNNIVSFQVALSNDKNSSPVSRARLKVINSENITYQGGDDNIHTDLIRGGDVPIIFHLKVRVSNQALTDKTATVSLECLYENSNDTEESIRTDLSLRFYSEQEYKDFFNPYNAGDAVTDARMFFGRDTDIETYVNIMMSSPSKQFIFYGQKRSGKSSVLYWLQQRLVKNGAFCSRFSMGDLVADLREVTFYYQILYQIQEDLEDIDDDNTPSFYLPKTISEFEKENPTNPMLTLKKYMKAFKSACKKTPGWKDKLIVIMIDEFTYIYSYIKQGRIDDSIMKQWKSIIQDPKSSFSAVLVGQDVVPYFANEEYAKNAFQIIDKKRLTYLKETDALRLIIEPIRDEEGNSRYAQGAAELILNYTACNPYYIQMLCSYLVDYMHEKKAIKVTTADVSEVAERLVQAMSDSEFDNLISGGDSIEFGEIKENKILAVLYRIAKLTETERYCSRHDIVNYFKEGLLEGEEETIANILNNLVLREVIEINEGMYRIQVKLFQIWILKKKVPETASLKELEK